MRGQLEGGWLLADVCRRHGGARALGGHHAALPRQHVDERRDGDEARLAHDGCAVRPHQHGQRCHVLLAQHQPQARTPGQQVLGGQRAVALAVKRGQHALQLARVAGVLLLHGRHLRQHRLLLHLLLRHVHVVDVQRVAVLVHKVLGQVVVHQVAGALGVVHHVQRQQRVVVQLHAKLLRHVAEVLVVHAPALVLVVHLEQLAELERVVVLVAHLGLQPLAHGGDDLLQALLAHAVVG
mmetsp:Transcript_27476/g.69890  ORF Transcript_27476/g.69890 Transcript_27476/m.69890 type:complete len:238 (+) Transcript_27476:387-1100(+)